jgi:hypothetical protein
MAPLRYPSPVVGTEGQHVSLDHRDRLIEVGQHPSGQQASHARPQHDRVFAKLRHPAMVSPERRAA